MDPSAGAGVAVGTICKGTGDRAGRPHAWLRWPRGSCIVPVMLALIPVSVVCQQRPPQQVAREDPAWVIADRDKRVVYAVPGMDRVIVKRNVAYRHIDGDSLPMDAYLPTGMAPGERRPAIIFIHGGALPANLLTMPKDWGQFRSLGELAAASGFVGIVFNHRLFGSMNALPAAESDLLALIEFVRRQSETFLVDRDRLTLWAFSGSGVLLADALRHSPPYIRALVSYYAILDLGPPRPDSLAPGRIAPGILRTHSPLRVLDERRGVTPPMLLVRAGRDRPDINVSVDRFIAAAERWHARVEVVRHEEGGHGFDIEDDTPRTREVIQQTLQFIRTRNQR